MGGLAAAMAAAKGDVDDVVLVAPAVIAKKGKGGVGRKGGNGLNDKGGGGFGGKRTGDESAEWKKGTKKKANLPFALKPPRVPAPIRVAAALASSLARVLTAGDRPF